MFPWAIIIRKVRDFINNWPYSVPMRDIIIILFIIVIPALAVNYKNQQQSAHPISAP
jgi:hypothetical protein